jgi:hypothetical protein
MSKINAFSRVLNQKVKTHFYMDFQLMDNLNMTAKRENLFFIFYMIINIIHNYWNKLCEILNLHIFKKSLKIPKVNQKPLLEEGQTMQWPKEKGQKDKQRSIQYYTENWISSNTNPSKTGDESRALEATYIVYHEI